MVHSCLTLAAVEDPADSSRSYSQRWVGMRSHVSISFPVAALNA